MLSQSNYAHLISSQKTLPIKLLEDGKWETIFIEGHFSMIEVSSIQREARRWQQIKLTTWWKMGSKDRNLGITNSRIWRLNWTLQLLMFSHEIIKRKLAEAMDLLLSQHCFWQVVGDNFGRRRIILTQLISASKVQFQLMKEKNNILVLQLWGVYIQSRGESWVKMNPGVCHLDLWKLWIIKKCFASRQVISLPNKVEKCLWSAPRRS